MKVSRYVVVEKACCGTCVHYYQHYILSKEGRLHPLWYGHCGTPRDKRRTPGETCPYWKGAKIAEAEE